MQNVSEDASLGCEGSESAYRHCESATSTISQVRIASGGLAALQPVTVTTGSQVRAKLFAASLALDTKER